MTNWFEWGLALYLSNLILSYLFFSYLIYLRKLYRDNLGVQAKFSESQHDRLDSFAKVGIGKLGRWLLPWSWLAQDLRGELDSKVEQARLLSWWHWLNWLKLLYSGRKNKHSKFNVSSISSVVFGALHEPLFSNPIRGDYVRMTAVLGWFETASQILSVECGWQLIEMKHYHSATCSQPGYEVGHGFCPLTWSANHTVPRICSEDLSLVDMFFFASKATMLAKK